MSSANEVSGFRERDDQMVETKVIKGHSVKEGETRHSNPFLADGVLSRKADYILSHSTITRTELHIADPDLVPRPIPEQDMMAQKSSGNVHCESSRRPEASAVVGEGQRQGPVEVEVQQSTVTPPSRQKAEEVQLKQSKKCKCCVVQ